MNNYLKKERNKESERALEVAKQSKFLLKSSDSKIRVNNIYIENCSKKIEINGVELGKIYVFAQNIP